MGYGVKDKHPTIIHHYAFEEDEDKRISYPLFSAGFLMSVELLKRLVLTYLINKLLFILFITIFKLKTYFWNFLRIMNKSLEAIGSDFAIDASYELALLINLPIQHLPLKFCLKLSPDCVVHPQPERSECVCNDFNLLLTICLFYYKFYLQTRYGKVTKDSIYFAVKTCSKFHTDRIPVLQSTWGRDAVHIEYFSDKSGIL